MAVVPGTTYTILVGGQGSNNLGPYGGYPGGGGCYRPVPDYTAGGGGLSLFGPSAVVSDAWIVAGAGGGSAPYNRAGGPGGDTTAGAGRGNTEAGQGGGPASGGAKATYTSCYGGCFAATAGSQGEGGIGCVK